MSDAEMLRRLQMFFDGHILSEAEVIRETGLPEAIAAEVYAAIVKLRAMSV